MKWWALPQAALSSERQRWEDDGGPPFPDPQLLWASWRPGPPLVTEDDSSCRVRDRSGLGSSVLPFPADRP